jgi:hypothetical protein
MGLRAISWIGDNALNAVAYLSLMVAPPLRAKTWVGRLGSLYPAIATVDEARNLTKRLGGRGTCLSRSLAVAARCPGSQVVIGVIPPRCGGLPRLEPSRWSVDAHAWVEIVGVALLDGANSPWVEVGRLDVRSRRGGALQGSGGSDLA